jgi:predicted  nucleic acid-binding Zn-ribbon protein
MTEVLQKLDLHSATVEAGLVSLKDTVQTALQSLGADRDVKTQADNSLQKDESLLRGIEQKIVGLQLDVKGVQDSVQLSALAASKAPAAVDLSALETKLEAIMTAIQGIAIANPDDQHDDASEMKDTVATAEEDVAEGVSTITTGSVSENARWSQRDAISTDLSPLLLWFCSPRQPRPWTIPPVRTLTNSLHLRQSRWTMRSSSRYAALFTA